MRSIVITTAFSCDLLLLGTLFRSLLRHLHWKTHRLKQINIMLTTFRNVLSKLEKVFFISIKLFIVKALVWLLNYFVNLLWNLNQKHFTKGRPVSFNFLNLIKGTPLQNPFTAIPSLYLFCKILSDQFVE